jgi:hypothetical protein
MVKGMYYDDDPEAWKREYDKHRAPKPNGAVQWCWWKLVLGAAQVVHVIADVLRHRHREDRDESGRRYYPWDEGW